MDVRKSSLRIGQDEEITKKKLLLKKNNKKNRLSANFVEILMQILFDLF